jgi:DNA mismatch endonuclease (patch repair protein)
MQRQRTTGTAPEWGLRRELYRLGLRYRVDAAIPGLSRIRADVVFTTERIAIFVDGCFWHRCPQHASWPTSNAAFWRTKLDKNAERDRLACAALQVAGWSPIRVWEHEDPTVAALKVQTVVQERRAQTRRPQAVTNSKDGCHALED